MTALWSRLRRQCFSVRTPITLVAPLFTTCSVQGAGAQQQGISRMVLGHLEIAIGDDEARTLAKLQSRYAVTQDKLDPKVKRNPGVSSWIFERTAERSDSGHVIFTFARVTAVMRTWSPPQTAVDVSQGLIDILFRLVQDGRSQCGRPRQSLTEAPDPLQSP
jgi:hypothetical protein